MKDKENSASVKNLVSGYLNELIKGNSDIDLCLSKIM